MDFRAEIRVWMGVNLVQRASVRRERTIVLFLIESNWDPDQVDLLCLNFTSKIVLMDIFCPENTCD